MVNRSLLFFNKYGPITKDGFTFEGGYTKVIDSGDGDFLTSDTLWDFKVSKNNPTSAHTLQLLIYYIMGIHSIHNEFKSIKKLGIFNPRTNCVYLYNVSTIPQGIIDEVSKEVIGYKDDYSEKAENIAILPENNDMLSMAEIMKMLSCSRYMIMKYYSEKKLPLVKINNKYFINKYDLMVWIEIVEAERKRQQMTSLIIGIVTIIFVVIVMLVMFKCIGR